MPRHAFIGRTAAATIAFARHQVVFTKLPGNRFRISVAEENLRRAESALGVFFGTLHGEWETIVCSGVRLERDPDAIAPRPRVMFFAVSRIVGLSDAALARFGARPAWFYRKECQEQSTLFDRIPEPPIEGPEVDEVIAVLSGGFKANGNALISLVGSTPTMCYGFHTAATYEQAQASFTEDGFELVTTPADASWSGARWPTSLVRPS